MLLILTVVTVLSCVGFAAVAKVALVAARRLGLDPWEVVIWFGIAEAPVDELAAKRAAAPAERRRQPTVGNTVAGGLRL